MSACLLISFAGSVRTIACKSCGWTGELYALIYVHLQQCQKKHSEHAMEHQPMWPFSCEPISAVRGKSCTHRCR